MSLCIPLFASIMTFYLLLAYSPGFDDRLQYYSEFGAKNDQLVQLSAILEHACSNAGHTSGCTLHPDLSMYKQAISLIALLATTATQI